VLRQAAEHRGSALVEIYQNCPIFNDGAFDVLKDRDESQARLVRLAAGQEVAFGGPDGDANVVVARPDGGGVEVVSREVAAATGRAPVVHDPSAEDPSAQFALSRLDDTSMATVPVGVFRSVQRPAYDDLVRSQVDAAVSAAGRPGAGRRLHGPARGPDTWTVA
jgi:2-oxoglutarate ferredoxin oxidoreductase subunit beta